MSAELIPSAGDTASIVVDVWRIDLAALRPTRQEFEALLSPDERAHAARYARDVDRERYGLTRGALRRLLSRRGHGPAERIAFAYSPLGKPRLAAGGAEFNVAHSHQAATIAICDNHPIGVDVERAREIDDVDGLVARMFASEEVASWKNLPASDRRRGFFAAWTRKEAILKATGEGMSRALDSFAVSLDEDPRVLRFNGGDASAWRLFDLSNGEYAGALAIRAAGAIRLKEADF